MASDTTTSDVSGGIPDALVREARETAGTGPWTVAGRRLRRNKVACAFGVLFLAVLACGFLAPVWADNVAKSDPYANHINDQIRIDGKLTDVVAARGAPIGPTYQGKFFLGADGRNGRDLMVRVLYGIRNSAIIGLGASLITLILALTLGLVAGYFRGWVDTVISRGMDVMWAFPVVLLGIGLGVSLNLGGLNLGLFSVSAGSKWVPTIIIGVVSVVYLARPLRGQVLSLREKEFVEAARSQGLGPFRIMFGELMPNLVSSLVVFFPLIVANAIALEAALSFLGAGVQPPEPSLGVIIAEGVDQLTTAPHVTISGGIALVLIVLSLNVFGDGVRDAIDPRAKVRLEH